MTVKNFLMAAVLCGIPGLAVAQEEVPAIQQANMPLPQFGPEQTQPAQQGAATQVVVPAGKAPPVPLLSPSAPLSPKEKVAVTVAHHWAARPVMPHPGEDGVVRYVYGATSPSVICAPWHVCDIALEAGEVVNNVRVGDKDRWNVTLGVSGNNKGVTTNILVKPIDAGLRTNLIVMTDRRTYSIDLVSTQTQFTPLVAFSYPGEDTDNSLSAYQQQMRSFVGAAQSSEALQFYCIRPDGASPSWIPVRAYTDGRQTTIEFPAGFINSTAPALVSLSGSGGLFSGPTKTVVNYRTYDNKFVADTVLDRAMLVSGVGGDQQSVSLRRGCK